MKYIILLIFIILLVLGGYFYFGSHKTITQNTSKVQKSSVTIRQSKGKHMTISSSAFANNSSISSEYTCDGKGVNPPLTFSNVPSEAKSLVMLMDDPDVPKNLKPDGVFDHWTIYNIDPKVTEIKEDSIPAGTQGLNGVGQAKYTPACPPDREHRYFFKLYALDSMLDFEDPSKVTKEMVIEKMQGHILEEAELIGLYNRPQNK